MNATSALAPMARAICDAADGERAAVGTRVVLQPRHARSSRPRWS